MILTLNIDANVVENVENYAKSTKKSVSQLVEDYLLSISVKNRVNDYKLLEPITRQLAGVIKSDKKINNSDFLTSALMEKYL